MLQQYDIGLEGQLGERYGILSWEEREGIVSGVLTLLGFENPVHGKKCENRLELVYDLRTAVSTIACRTVLELQGETLQGRVCFASGAMKMFGRKKKETESL